MISEELNQRLTQVGPGTPTGELMRRYWHPVGAAADLENEPVQPVRLLGENLTLFKTTKGEVGLIGERCAHRAISLAYGVPQDNGLRCAYHGWTYNTAGRVVDMPFEPACLPLKVKAYPVEELGGLIWAYLGPEPVPLLPRYEHLASEEWQRTISFKLLPCNWLQCMDNSLDPVHFEHLHAVYGNYLKAKLGRGRPMNPARHVKIDFDVFEYGIYKRRLLEGDPEDVEDWTIGHPILFPNILAQVQTNGGSYQFRVPVDDTTTLHLLYGVRRAEGQASGEIAFKRESLAYDQWGRVFGGVERAVPQDEMAWVGQGPVSDRTREHLATSDKGVILYHNMLLTEIEKVERGEDPLGVVRDPAKNFPMIRFRTEVVAREAFTRGRPDIAAAGA